MNSLVRSRSFWGVKSETQFRAYFGIPPFCCDFIIRKYRFPLSNLLEVLFLKVYPKEEVGALIMRVTPKPTEIDFERRFQQVPPQAEPYRAALTAIDCSEFEIRRPLHGQRLFYSGNIIFTASRLEDGLCVWINGPVRGAAHDSTIVADLDTALQPGEEVVADLGYVGFRRAVLPKKRAPGGELTDADQQHNFRHRMVRANVEHYFSRVKSFRFLKSLEEQTFLHKPALWLSATWLISGITWNPLFQI
ncbi:hypothetical protein PAPYR_12914 [Paratrimastix pyriformis]|uniref:DDE Tnp4 domain-containing protein n=1 Tax=Paratrimastix pyriformis TaxID=342808 RepID=A0ABQ8U151_9EUKA|nr:hypothetical protein PAPYR_12914 [Paratrimastix pyriformis]